MAIYMYINNPILSQALLPSYHVITRKMGLWEIFFFKKRQCLERQCCKRLETRETQVNKSKSRVSRSRRHVLQTPKCLLVLSLRAKHKSQQPSSL